MMTRDELRKGLLVVTAGPDDRIELDFGHGLPVHLDDDDALALANFLITRVLHRRALARQRESAACNAAGPLVCAGAS